MPSVIDDVSRALVTSLQRQLDDVSRDLMTPPQVSRDAEWLRDWLDEERKMRRDMMTSQELLQRALVDCLGGGTERQLAVNKVDKTLHRHGLLASCHCFSSRLRLTLKEPKCCRPRG